MMLHVTTAVLFAMLAAATGSKPDPEAIAPRLDQLAQRCQAQRGIATEAFRAFLRNPKRQRAGWTVVVSGATSEVREREATKIAGITQAKLRRVTLDEVVGKYIGETEKNLTRLFDEAARDGVVLFFDEADALFGKRTEVQSSHDRYANQEVSYVTERLKAHPELVIVGASKPGDTVATSRWADTVVASSPEDGDTPVAWHRLCWPPRAGEARR
jgi:hypothetical protein